MDREYRLVVLQHPVRARVCGFGDRDRRIITPPIIVQLLVYDTRTQKQIPSEDIDITFFVVNADLWDASKTHEVNMVMHPAFSVTQQPSRTLQEPAPPAIPQPSPTTSWPASSPTIQQQAPPPPSWAYNQPQQYYYPSTSSQPWPAGPSNQWCPTPEARPRLPPIASLTTGFQNPSFMSNQYVMSRSIPMAGPSSAPAPSPTQPETEMTYTRNMIGQLAQNAHRLSGMDGRQGIYFIYHDLSVRTEGIFSIRLVFVSIAENGIRSENTLNVLAEVFTDPFQVYSAKKFPGMIQPSDLLKHFGTQGIRVPMRTRYRSSRAGEEGDAGMYDDDDY